jgi:hypothetical protein
MAEAPSSDDGVSAAIVTLLRHLPEQFQGLWWTINEYCDMLRRGGLKDDLNVALVRAAIRTDASGIFSLNRSKKEKKYLIGDAIWPGFVPKDQEEYFKDTSNHSPRMQVDWFLKSRLLAVKSAVDTIASRHGKKCDHDVENHATDGQKVENHETDALPMQAQHVSGIKLIDIDTDREWTNIVAQHVMKCGSLFKFVKSEKKKVISIESNVILEKFCRQPEWGRKQQRVRPIAVESSIQRMHAKQGALRVNMGRSALVLTVVSLAIQ